MRRSSLAAAALTALSLAAACGGTSSETPWPVEPSGPALGPSGEGDPTQIPAEGEPPAPPADPAAKDAGR